MKISELEHYSEQIPWQLVQQSNNFDPGLGEQISVVKDEQELAMLLQAGDQVPDYHTRKLFTIHQHGDIMDRTDLLQGFWLKLHTPTIDTYDVTYIQVLTHIDFIHVFRRGIGSIFGHNQELKFQRMGSRMMTRGCWHKYGDRPESPMARHICQEHVLAHINDNMDKIIENKIIHNFNLLLDTTWINNEWHIMPTIDYSF